MRTVVQALRDLFAPPRPRTILVVDDAEVDRRIATEILNKRFRVITASGGREGVDLAREKLPDLILLDFMMPDMNGYEVTAVIRDPSSAVRRHDIPIIALTGNAMKQDRDNCLAAGMDDHLPKPLLLADLLAKLEWWLGSESNDDSDAMLSPEQA